MDAFYMFLLNNQSEIIHVEFFQSLQYISPSIGLISTGERPEVWIWHCWWWEDYTQWSPRSSWVMPQRDPMETYSQKPKRHVVSPWSLGLCSGSHPHIEEMYKCTYMQSGFVRKNTKRILPQQMPSTPAATDLAFVLGLLMSLTLERKELRTVESPSKARTVHTKQRENTWGFKFSKVGGDFPYLGKFAVVVGSHFKDFLIWHLCAKDVGQSRMFPSYFNSLNKQTL